MPAFPAPQAGVTLAGVWRAVVTRVDEFGRPYVEVPRLAPGYELGPLDSLQGVWTTYLRTGMTSGGAGDDAFASHDHDVGSNIAVGDRVLVAFVEGRVDEAVVLGRLA